MTNDVMVASAVDPQVAEAIALQERLEPLRDALGIADLTPQEMSLYSMVCLRLELDPFARQIFAIRRKGKLTYQVSIDGMRSSAEATREYRGSEEPTWGPIIERPFPHPEWAQVTVRRELRDGSRFDQSATVWWDEYYPGEGPDGFKWRQSPRVMLAKCAESSGLRKAFPRRFGQVYVTEEMDQADAAERAMPIAATVTTHRDAIAAQRAQLEATTSAPFQSGAVQGAVLDALAAADPSPVPTPSGAGESEAVITKTGEDAVPVQSSPALQCESTSPYEGAARCGGVEGHAGLHRSKLTKESW